MTDKPKKGSLVLELDTGIVYTVKYILRREIGDTVVVNNGRYDFPLMYQRYILINTPLLEELL